MKISPTEKRNVLLLASLQALFQTASVSLIVFSGLVGLDLTSEKSLATLPIALMMVAAATTMIPASMLMQRLGRKTGFFIGSLTGCLAGLIGAFAVWVESFWLFVFANMLFGSYQAFAQYYRFAAAEAASEDFKSRAISWVIAGGVVAAIAGPNITRLTESVGTVPFMASCLALFVLSIVSSLLALCLSLTTPAEHTYDRSGARPLPEIMRQPVFIAALASSSIGYAVMIMVMTATPLAMKIYGHIFERGEEVKLTTIEGPKTEWKDLEEIFSDALGREQKVTAMINDMVDLSIEISDHATKRFLDWFVEEQVEEEATANDVLNKVKMAKGSPGALFMLDNQMSQRVFTPPVTTEE